MVRIGFAIGVLFSLVGCSAPNAPANSDTSQVLHALSATLTADNKPVCIDGATSGDSLAVFRAMISAPPASRQPLAWHQPQPLRPPTSPSGWRVFNDEIRDDRILIPRPQQMGGPLPFLLQRQLDFAANKLSLVQGSEAFAISKWAGAPLARPRWWIANRLSPDCSPVFTIMNPVVAKNLAFVSVKAGHWGTTYAFAKQGARWKVIGQWTNWLY